MEKKVTKEVVDRYLTNGRYDPFKSERIRKEYQSRQPTFRPRDPSMRHIDLTGRIAIAANKMTTILVQNVFINQSHTGYVHVIS